MGMTPNGLDVSRESFGPGEFSRPVQVNLENVDDDGDVLVDSFERVVCEGGGVTIPVKWIVFF
jgi:hypothetical protein